MAPLAIENPLLYRASYFLDSPVHEPSSCNIPFCRCKGPLAPVPEKVSQHSPLQRRRRVSFSDTVGVQEVAHLNDLSQEDVISRWWTPADYGVIKRMYKITVQLMMQGETFADDDNDFCSRGLEARTKIGSHKRHTQKQRVVKAVLKAQEFQRREGFNDPEYIAELCSQLTSCGEAHKSAIADRLAI